MVGGVHNCLCLVVCTTVYAWWCAQLSMVGGVHNCLWLVVCTTVYGWWCAQLSMVGGVHNCLWLVVCTTVYGWWCAQLSMVGGVHNCLWLVVCTTVYGCVHLKYTLELSPGSGFLSVTTITIRYISMVYMKKYQMYVEISVICAFSAQYKSV